MNKIILTLLMCLWLYAAMATDQRKTVPSGVITAFKTKYPGAGNESWMNDPNGYVVRFYNSGKPYTVRFNNKGEWLDETRKLGFGDLENNVKNAFSQSKFATWRAYEVNAIQEKNKEIQYRILIGNSDLQKKYIYYDSKGQLKKEILTM